MSKEIPAAVIFCVKCGKPAMNFNRWLRGTSASLTCQHCGSSISVKGAMVNTTGHTIDEMEAKLLEKSANVPPKDYLTTEEQRENAKKNRPTSDKGWCNLGFRVTLGQREVVRAAMEACRQSASYKGKLWHGVALERICADFLAGAQKLQKLPDASELTEAALKKMKGAMLDYVTTFIFSMSVNRMFRDDDEKRDWILKNMPPEIVSAKKIKVKKAKKKEKPKEEKQPKKLGRKKFSANDETGYPCESGGEYTAEWCAENCAKYLSCETVGGLEDIASKEPDGGILDE